MQTSKPMIAGILLIVFGLINIGNSIFSLTVLDSTLDQVSNIGTVEEDLVRNFAYAFIALGIVFSIIAIIGGYFATQRTKYTVAIIGSIFGLLSGGPVCLASLTALIALILIYTSKHEFNGAGSMQGPPPMGPPPMTGPPPGQPPGY
jgi:hypothetical protein